MKTTTKLIILAIVHLPILIINASCSFDASITTDFRYHLPQAAAQQNPAASHSKSSIVTSYDQQQQQQINSND